MGPHGRDEGHDGLRLRLQEGSEAEHENGEGLNEPLDTVFDFTGLQRPDLSTLSLLFTARLQANPEDRVWVRALPDSTWRVLYALGLDHLFMPYPGTDEPVN